jgi:hypothetical protein
VRRPFFVRRAFLDLIFASLRLFANIFRSLSISVALANLCGNPRSSANIPLYPRTLANIPGSPRIPANLRGSPRLSATIRRYPGISRALWGSLRISATLCEPLQISVMICGSLQLCQRLGARPPPVCLQNHLENCYFVTREFNSGVTTSMYWEPLAIGYHRGDHWHCGGGGWIP